MKTVLIITVVLMFSLAFVKTQDDEKNKSPNDTSLAAANDKAAPTTAKSSKNAATVKTPATKDTSTKAPSSEAEDKSVSGTDQDNSVKQKDIVEKMKQKYIRPELDSAQIGSRKYGDIYSEQLMIALSKMDSKQLDKLTGVLG